MTLAKATAVGGGIWTTAHVDRIIGQSEEARADWQGGQFDRAIVAASANRAGATLRDTLVAAYGEVDWRIVVALVA